MAICLLETRRIPTIRRYSKLPTPTVLQSLIYLLPRRTWTLLLVLLTVHVSACVTNHIVRSFLNRRAYLYTAFVLPLALMLACGNMNFQYTAPTCSTQSVSIVHCVFTPMLWHTFYFVLLPPETWLAKPLTTCTTTFSC